MSDTQSDLDIESSKNTNPGMQKEFLDYKTVLSPQNRPIKSMCRMSESLLAFSSHRIWVYDTNVDKIK